MSTKTYKYTVESTAHTYTVRWRVYLGFSQFEMT